MDSERVEHLLGQLTLEEKVSLLAGEDMWKTPAIERLGIPLKRPGNAHDGRGLGRHPPGSPRAEGAAEQGMTLHRRQQARRDIVEIADSLDRVSQALSDRLFPGVAGTRCRRSSRGERLTG